MVLRDVGRRVRVFPDLAAASDALAAGLVRRAAAAVRLRGRFRLVISGGKTPLGLYAALAGAYRDRMPWAATDLFFADERCVAPRSVLSNYGAAWRSFLSRVPIPRSRLHRMQGELRPIGKAARVYAEIVGSVPRPGRGAEPLFDLVLLGIGPDGHTASLFPGQPSLREQRATVVAVPRSGQAPFVPRLTLTPPALSSSRDVWFLVAGADKVDALRATFAPVRRGGTAPPAALVRPPGPATWFLDRAAARALRPGRAAAPS